MKKVLIHIVFILFSFVGYGQTVSIPDPVFLNFLKTNYPQTINSSNQLVTSIAAQVTGTISDSSLGITNLEGIQYFSKITKINFSNNAIVATPVDAVTITQTSGSGITKRYPYAKLTHPSLPALTLITDTILVRFNPCPASADVATKKDCGNSGALQIEVQGYAPPQTTYMLTSSSLGTTEYYNLNRISALADTAYSLQISFAPVCVANYTTSIKIPAVDCNEAFMTPNNDGDMGHVFVYR